LSLSETWWREGFGGEGGEVDDLGLGFLGKE
jgi:hypothetical protein